MMDLMMAFDEPRTQFSHEAIAIVRTMMPLQIIASLLPLFST